MHTIAANLQKENTQWYNSITSLPPYTPLPPPPQHLHLQHNVKMLILVQEEVCGGVSGIIRQLMYYCGVTGGLQISTNIILNMAFSKNMLI